MMYFRLSKPKRCFLCFISATVIVCLFFVFSRYGTSNSSSHTIIPSRIEPFQNDILLTPRNYHSENLYGWKPPTKPPIYDLPGEMGEPIYLDSMEEEAEKRFNEHEFNVVVSEMISQNRSLPEVRNPQCLTITYQSRLPKTSVIIIFYNEAWCTLVRSIWSIINRSPKELVREIILVDDKSTFDFLGDQLDEYVKTLPIDVQLLRMKERNGIVMARLRGAEYAKGEVITFLDSHIECTEGWLEPLLSRIAVNRRIVAIPIIDIIDDKTFKYTSANDELWGGFDWRLFFQWVEIPQREINRIANNSVAPLYTPTMAGGIFTMDKEFFFEIGAYDEGMKIWGCENLEMSFRVWMCGGILELIKCSRVGHVFRKKSPYIVPDEEHYITQKRNKYRLVDVWLDEWITFYDTVNPDRENEISGDITSRIALREKLKCKDFQWYIDNIYPEVDVRKNYSYIGQIQNVDSQTCLVAYQENTNPFLQTCSRTFIFQVFFLTNLDEIRMHDLCLDAAAAHDGVVKALKCNQREENQKWKYDVKNMTFRHNSGSCLQRDSPIEKWVNVKPCDGSKQQQWLLITKST